MMLGLEKTCCLLSAEFGAQHGPLMKYTLLFFLNERMAEVLNKGMDFIATIGREILRHLSWVKDSEQTARFFLKIPKRTHQISKHL